MPNQTSIPMRCRKFEARLEDYLDGASDAELDEHLLQCANCRAALENSRSWRETWLRQAWEPTGEPRPAFLAGVMAKIREEKAARGVDRGVLEPAGIHGVALIHVGGRLAPDPVRISGGICSAPGVARLLANRTELSASDFPQPPRRTL